MNQAKSLFHFSTHSISYFHGIGSKPILYRTIGEQLELTSQKFSQNIALISQHQQKAFTYHELTQEVHKIAASFLALGLKKHDRIGIYSPNCYEWYLTQLAASLSDLILVNINPAYQASELEYALNKVECKALITASSFKSSNYLQMLDEIAPEISKSKLGELKSARLPHLQILIKIQDEKIKNSNIRRHRRRRPGIPGTFRRTEIPDRRAETFGLGPFRREKDRVHGKRLHGRRSEAGFF